MGSCLPITGIRCLCHPDLGVGIYEIDLDYFSIQIENKDLVILPENIEFVVSNL